MRNLFPPHGVTHSPHIVEVVQYEKGLFIHIIYLCGIDFIPICFATI